MEIETLEAYLKEEKADFALIRQAEPIISVADAANYFPVEKAAPALVITTEKGLYSVFVSSGYGKLNFAKLKKQFGFQKMKMADRESVFGETGFHAGAVPLVGLKLPCLMDKQLFQYDYVYGGTGDPLYTLKIAPKDIERLNHITGYF